MSDKEPPKKNAPANPGETDLRIDADEWVSQVEQRRQRRGGLWGKIEHGWKSIPEFWQHMIVVGVLLLAPVATNTAPVLKLLGISSNDFIIRTGARFLVFAILAIGLNVVVGYAGLLDLGYVAFYGIAGYAYAYLSSDFVKIGDLIPHGLQVPSIVSIPLIIALTALIGWVLGSVSLRLVGDYLAIVTLGFGQVFVQLALTTTRVKLFWLQRPVDLTRGPNGINKLDNIRFFGYQFESTIQYYYLFLIFLVLVYLMVRHLNRSRIGRSWRAMREDELAAELMGIPTRRMKLMAFAMGAGIAALAGAVDAAWQGNVVPVPRYGVLNLINLYAIVVMGGIGSLPGVVLGAFVFTALPEVLRNIQFASMLFYGGSLVGLFIYLKPVKRFLTMMLATIGGGLFFKLIVNWLWPGLDTGYPEASSILNRVIQGWLVIPVEYKIVGNIVIGSAILMLLLTIVAKPPWRWLFLGTTIYMFTFAWETRLVVEPSATRILIIGATLITLMIVRPQGLMGKTEVRIT